MPQSRKKGDTTSDYLSEDSRFLIEVQSLSYIDATKGCNNHFISGIKRQLNIVSKRGILPIMITFA